ncbi:Spy/CpxP family protein refolding chaperone [Psychromonas ossibalaenae]|uniref:Spy/CpxP family protein refolding chaperone n=1 Tax=Psychromonas ossibalaenae TaxID=444922 RepID=UPI000360F6C6|nr:Spy/CpxP family protein refolding chaperone [Psychromonas ossibalaenae]
MNSLLKNVLLASVILPLTFSTAYAKSDCKKGHNAMSFKSMLKQVELTSEQQADIKSIMQSYRSEKGTYHERKMAIMKASDFNEAQAITFIEETNTKTLRKDKRLNNMKMTHEVYQSLMPEQQAKMDLLFEQRQQKMQNKKAKCAQQKNK